MEFKEFFNPEQKDYDIDSTMSDEKNTNVINNIYSNQLIDMIGILEDITDEQLQEEYGITMKEYLNPDAEVIKKVYQAINYKQRGRSK